MRWFAGGNAVATLTAMVGTDTEGMVSRKQAAELAGCSQATVRRAEGIDIRVERHPLIGRDGKPRGTRVWLCRADVVKWAAARRRDEPIGESAAGNVSTSIGIDGRAMARILKLFREGAEPVDVAIDLEVELETVMAVWRQYHDALGHTPPGERLDALDAMVQWLRQQLELVPRDSQGERVDQYLPWLLESELPGIRNALHSLRCQIEAVSDSRTP